MSRLAVATTDALVVLDKQALKDAPASVSPACNFLAQPTALAWAPDNSCLFLSLPDAVEKYDPAGAHVDTVYPTPDPIAALLSKDKGNTLIFAARHEVTVLETHSRRVAHTFATHRHPIVGLALSGDATLLAAISSNAAHVYNLSPASHTILRGFPSGTFTACAFHPHTRTRLLLGIGLHVAVYDTTRSSGPVKTINLEKGAGDIVAITSSPFSKTLIAIACSGGSVTLIDLEKEKGVIRTIPMHEPLTSLVFSPEGAALYAGTEGGNVLIIDLRALDKPPRMISVSETGQRIVNMTIQRKLKQDRLAKSRSSLGETKAGRVEQEGGSREKRPISRRVAPSVSSPAIKKTASSSSLRLTPSKSNPGKSLPASPGLTRAQTLPSASAAPRTGVSGSSEAGVVPVRARAISSTTSASTLSSRVTSSTTSRPATASSRTTVSTSVSTRKVSATRAQTQPFSPPKSPLSKAMGMAGDIDVSVRVENLLGLPKAKRATSLHAADRDDEQMVSTATTTRVSAASRVSTRQSVRTRTVSASATSPSATASARAASARAGSTLRPRVESASGPSRAGTTTGASGSRTPTDTNVNGTRPPSRPNHARKPSGASSVSIPRVNIDGSRANSPTEQLTEIRLAVSRTPSPETIPPQVPEAPMPFLGVKPNGKGKERAGDKQDALNVLGLGTPEVRQWVAAGGLGDDDDDDVLVPRERGRVGFLDPNHEDEDPLREVQIQSIEVLPAEKDKAKAKRLRPGGTAPGNGEAEEATIKMTVQISPRRPTTHLTPSASPLRGTGPLPGLGAGIGAGVGGTGTNPAHDLLHALIRDALYDFRRETRAEIIGLHLDLVKMGRGWRKEMREALDKWSEELQEVREENKQLREENERLRRGY